MSDYDYRFEDKLERDLPRVKNNIYSFMYEFFNLIADIRFSSYQAAPVTNRILLDKILKNIHLNITSGNSFELKNNELILKADFLKYHLETLHLLDEFKNRKIIFMSTDINSSVSIYNISDINNHKYKKIELNPIVRLHQMKFFKPQNLVSITIEKEKRCSGFGIYPTGINCEGCLDCKPLITIDND